MTTLAKLLERNRDGAGLIDGAGHERRSFYWEIVAAPRLERVRRPQAPALRPSSPASLPDLVLTPRQFVVAESFITGLSMEAIADRLGISTSTTSVHLRDLRERYLRSGRWLPTRAAMLAEFDREIPAVAFRGRLVSPARPGAGSGGS